MSGKSIIRPEGELKVSFNKKEKKLVQLYNGYEIPFESKLQRAIQEYTPELL
uniref:Uncharacterized protein n=1 Tax=Nelumbo nucifera TaxID=4432 RepID=A0A822YD73_NELNU|nr:TPA_asm: hypothetical protein HUJ06_031551 [Nelumbo nucifera]